MEQVVRRAVPEDHPVLNELENEARAAVRETRGGARWCEVVPARRGRWFDDGAQVFVAEIDAVGVGYLVLIPGEVAVVESVFVTPGAREVGFGDWLLEAALSAAVEEGSRLLEGTALPGDRDLKNLFERAGIVARAITVSVPLRPSQS
ncbi:MAG: GNAT family N-acetyltransferase [Ilumatobacteraceae bacterium]